MSKIKVTADSIEAKNLKVTYEDNKSGRMLSVWLPDKYVEIFYDIKESLEDYYEDNEIESKVSNGTVIRKALKVLAKLIEDGEL